MLGRKKKEIADALMQELIKKLPQLQGKLTCIDVWTPATYQRYTGSEIGSYMSFALPSGMLPIRVGNRVREIFNVILATQWQQVPGGLPIAAEGGKIAVETIMKLEQRTQSSARYKHKLNKCDK